MLELLIFDSHPVQYRVPIWKALHKAMPNKVHIAYATTCSVQGYHDAGFSKKIAWDEPMLEAYNYTDLQAENGQVFSAWSSLNGKGVKNIIKQLKPRAILLTGLNYQFDQVALWEARQAKIPVYLRCETQDKAFFRSKWKSNLRSIYYKQLYRFIDRFFYIGQLNKQHYIQHGVQDRQLSPAHYFTVNRFANLTNTEKNEIRIRTRTAQKIKENAHVIGFSGKFIPKKNPQILFQLLDRLPESLRSKIVLYFMGSGELEVDLKALAQQYQEKYGTKTIFTGFVNQSEIAPHYLAMDTLVLPSRQMGETWGLVVNEAMQAGCSVLVSNFVGCGADFKALERFRIFEDNDAQDLASKLNELITYQRDFNWANTALKAYSLEACVRTLTQESFKSVQNA